MALWFHVLAVITDPRVKFPCLTLSIDYYYIVVHIIKCIIIWWLRTLLLSWTRAHDDRVCHLSSVNKTWLTFSGCQRILWQEIFSTEIDWRGSDRQGSGIVFGHVTLWPVTGPLRWERRLSVVLEWIYPILGVIYNHSLIRLWNNARGNILLSLFSFDVFRWLEGPLYIYFLISESDGGDRERGLSPPLMWNRKWKWDP